jgi:hypothetical protein
MKQTIIYLFLFFSKFNLQAQVKQAPLPYGNTSILNTPWLCSIVTVTFILLLIVMGTIIYRRGFNKQASIN